MLEWQKKNSSPRLAIPNHIRLKQQFHENELKPSVTKLSVYEEVLQEVVDEMDIFKSKEDFLDRIDALREFEPWIQNNSSSDSLIWFEFSVLVQKEVSENDDVTLEAIEEMQADIVKLSNEATVVIAGLENKLAEVEVKHDV